MEQKTAVDLVFAAIQKVHKMDWDLLYVQAKEIEKQQIKDAVIYGLDEDGHTGDWKISVAQKYYNKTFTDGDSGTKAD
jgi:hypothetical protein